MLSTASFRTHSIVIHNIHHSVARLACGRIHAVDLRVVLTRSVRSDLLHIAHRRAFGGTKGTLPTNCYPQVVEHWASIVWLTWNC